MNGTDGSIEIFLEGFVTADELRSCMDDCKRRYSKGFPPSALVDLDAALGYGPGTPSLARRWLIEASNNGVKQVAVIAGSSVLHTAIQLLSAGPDLDLYLRSFKSTQQAREWLGPYAPPSTRVSAGNSVPSHPLRR